MKLASLQAIPIALPLRRRYVTASGQLDARRMVVVRVRGDDGVEGLGEAVPLSLRGGPGIDEVLAELDACGHELAGTEVRVEAGAAPAPVAGWVGEALGRVAALGVGAQVLAAIDVALHDLAGRIAGLPVWRLLGAERAAAVPCNATLDAADPETCAELAAEQAAARFGTFKVKVGTGDDADVARIAAVRDAIGPGALLRVDANGAWDPDRALGVLGRLEAQGLELVEQPCPDLAGLARVRAATGLPVVADESVAGLEDAEAALAAGACDAATLKLAKVGGPRAALRIAATVPSYLSSALDGPIGIAAAVHTAQALPPPSDALGFAHGLATLEMFSAAYAPCEALSGPLLDPPNAPGLGVELEEPALEELRLR